MQLIYLLLSVFLFKPGGDDKYSCYKIIKVGEKPPYYSYHKCYRRPTEHIAVICGKEPLAQAASSRSRTDRK